MARLIGPNGVVTTDTEGDGATTVDPVEVTVTSPNGGLVSIVETPATGNLPAGFSILDWQVTLAIPPAAPTDPVIVVFQLDASLIPAGGNTTIIEVFRDQVLVPSCPGDPCVSARLALGEGDVEITVLTSTGSLWNFAVDSCAGVVCDDGNPCTDDACDPVGGCLNTPNTAPCDDGNACTTNDTCRNGMCTSASQIICAALDQCHDAGLCDPTTGACSNPPKQDGTTCDDGNVCTAGDTCIAGTCTGTALPDNEGDGVCDAIDVCPLFFDPAQTDEDQNGVGDICECTTPVPGRCIAGGGSARTDCLLEFNTTGPVRLNRKGTRVRRVVSCNDGDPACDRDGVSDGKCTFGVALCVANSDPRLPRCAPSEIRSFEVLRPNPNQRRSTVNRNNAIALEQALGTLGVEIRRRRRVVLAAVGPSGVNRCTPVADLITPAPRSLRGRKAVRRKLVVQATAVNGRRDRDRLILECRR